MGIFGRDERSPQATPDPPASSGRQRTTNQPADAGCSIVAGSNRFEGTISGSGDIEIEGELKGTVDGTGRLRVATGGSVEGNLAARTVVVAGAVRGDILAGETIELEASASVEGNITAPRIRIADGASLEGKVHMKGSDRPHRPRTASVETHREAGKESNQAGEKT